MAVMKLKIHDMTPVLLFTAHLRSVETIAMPTGTKRPLEPTRELPAKHYPEFYNKYHAYYYHDTVHREC